ncbi:MAG: Stp1/IreP family PP2C-type Ser/Thr phosphatase [Solirubrobacterales bacterium]
MLRVDDLGIRSDTGRQRTANEDSCYVRAPVFVIADGMGGAQAGEVASKAAVDVFERDLREGPPEQMLSETIEAANREIHDLARSDPSLAGMGTTLTAAVVDAGAEEVAIGHVGDSRAYRLRDGRLERLTRDHSLVEEMRRKGQITEAQAEDHPQRSVITRALGPEPEVEVDLQTVPALAGDVFLLCSDGLTDMIGEAAISRLLAGATSMEAAVRALVAEANRAGGRDNITAVAFRLEDAATVAPAAPAGPAPSAAPADRAPSAEPATLVGPSAEQEGFTAEEVRRRAAAERRAAGGRRRLRTAAKVAAAALVLAALVLAASYGIRQVWFLGTDRGGRVALYRGLPYELPLGVKLYEQRYSIPVQTDSLPPRRRDAVRGHDLRSRSDAISLIGDIERSQGISADGTAPVSHWRPKPPPSTGKGRTASGSAQGQGGSAQGGTAQGGSAQGGTAQGASTQNGAGAQGGGAAQ